MVKWIRVNGSVSQPLLKEINWVKIFNSWVYSDPFHPVYQFDELKYESVCFDPLTFLKVKIIKFYIKYFKCINI